MNYAEKPADYAQYLRNNQFLPFRNSFSHNNYGKIRIVPQTDSIFEFCMNKPPIPSRRLALLLLFVLATIGSRAQQPFLHSYSVSDGLPSNEVYDIFQDSQGFLWFATDAGASRYDGYRFVNFTSRDGLPDNVVFGFFEDHCGRIWFRTYNGLLSYFDGTRIIQPPVNTKLRSLLKGCVVNSIYVDKKDTLWLGISGDHPLVCVLPGFNDIGQSSLRGTQESIIREMAAGAYLVSGRLTTTGSPVWFYPQKSVQPVELGVISSSISSINCSQLPSGGTLLNSGTKWWIIEGGKIKCEGAAAMIIRATSYHDSTFWICKGRQEGADLVQNSTNGLRVIRTVLRDYSVTDCLQDHEGGVWFSTLEGGVYYMPYPEVEDYSDFAIAPGEKFMSLAVFGSRHVLVLSSVGNIFSPNSDDVTFPVQGGQRSYYTCMLISNETIAVGSYENSFIFNPRIDQRIPIHDSANNIIPFVSLAAIDSSYMYGVAIRSLFLINLHTGIADTLYCPLPERMRCICTGQNDTLWMGGLTGLWAIPRGGTPVNMGETKPELSERIDFIYYDSTTNRLWMSSKGKGLMLMESGRMVDLTGLNPAIPANCRAIYADEEKNIWVATNLGVYCVSEKADGHFTSREFSVRNGLPSNDIAGITRIGDTLWLAAADRVIRFRLSEYPVNRVPPPLKVKKILADGNEIVPWPADSLYEFTAGTGTITFTYSALSFKSLGHVNYQFRLEGADTSWKSTQSTETAFYALPPGEYSFNLIARNNDGAASPPLVLRFVILPPVWQRWWFIALAVFSITAVLVAIAKNHFQRLRKQQLFNQRLVEMEMTALRAQMSPHFIFNAINSIHNFVLTGDRNSSATYLSKFARLIRNVLENSSQKQITLAKEIETLRLYLEIERMRFSEDFSFTITTDGNLDADRVTIIPLLLQPYVENAIWHGLLHKKGHGSLLVSVKDAGDMLLCIIDDDGIGREMAAINKQHRMGSASSMGGEISQRRLNLLNDQYGTRYSVTYTDKKNNDGTAAGTRVELLIPKFIKNNPANESHHSR